MITVYKYEIKSDFHEVDLPRGAEILSVQFQGKSLFLWAKVDNSVQTEKRSFHVFSTGGRIGKSESRRMKFIGTAHTESGLVFHVFESEIHP